MSPATQPVPPSERQIRRFGEAHRDLRVQPVDGGVHPVREEEHRDRFGRRVGRGHRRRARRADVQAHDGAGLLTRGEERVPVTGVQRRQPELLGRLGEGDGAEPARRVGAHLVGRDDRVAQPRDLVRHEAVGIRAAPRVEVPVVVRAERGEREVGIARPHREPLTDEAGKERREAERRPHPVDVHVGDARRCPTRRGASRRSGWVRIRIRSTAVRRPR